MKKKTPVQWGRWESDGRKAREPENWWVSITLLKNSVGQEVNKSRGWTVGRASSCLKREKECECAQAGGRGPAETSH